MTRRLPAIFDRTERMEWALKLMCARGKCENCATAGSIGDCFRSGRTPDAKYGAERVCVACLADFALHGRVRNLNIEGKLR
jgi:hypothetical protein